MEYENKTTGQLVKELTSLRERLEGHTAELAKANGRLKEQAALLELAHDAVIVRDLHGRIKYWSKGSEEIYGWERSEAEGRITHELPKTEFPIALEDLESMVLREGIWKGELIHTTRQNISIVVDSHWTLQRDRNGNPLAVIEINHDITARKVAESSLRKAVDQLRVRLQERTEDLTAANRALVESEERYRYWSRVLWTLCTVFHPTKKSKI
ncbi:MAG: PAS domain-containing protein [Syntrophobacteraceae bacterium]